MMRLRVGLGHLGEQQFMHNFQNSWNPICHCGSTSNFLFYFPILMMKDTFSWAPWITLIAKLLQLTTSSLSQTLLYDNTLFKKENNIHLFLTQLLDIFYPLKYSKSLLFSKSSLPSLNPSMNFLRCFILCCFLHVTFNIIFLFIYFFIPRHFGILIPGNCVFLNSSCCMKVFIKKVVWKEAPEANANFQDLSCIQVFLY